jgi:seryl-tRNA synthetase
MSGLSQLREELVALDERLRTESENISDALVRLDVALREVNQGLRNLGELENSLAQDKQIGLPVPDSKITKETLSAMGEAAQKGADMYREQIAELRAARESVWEKIAENEEMLHDIDVSLDDATVRVVDRAMPELTRYLVSQDPQPPPESPTDSSEKSTPGTEPDANPPGAGDTADGSVDGGQPPSPPSGTDDPGPPANGPGDAGPNGSDG